MLLDLFWTCYWNSMMFRETTYSCTGAVLSSVEHEKQQSHGSREEFVMGNLWGDGISWQGVDITTLVVKNQNLILRRKESICSKNDIFFHYRLHWILIRWWSTLMTNKISLYILRFINGSLFFHVFFMFRVAVSVCVHEPMSLYLRLLNKI